MLSLTLRPGEIVEIEHPLGTIRVKVRPKKEGQTDRFLMMLDAPRAIGILRESAKKKKPAPASG